MWGVGGGVGEEGGSGREGRRGARHALNEACGRRVSRRTAGPSRAGERNTTTTVVRFSEVTVVVVEVLVVVVFVVVVITVEVFVVAVFVVVVFVIFFQRPGGWGGGREL